MNKMALFTLVVFLFCLFLSGVSQADGCYICSLESKPKCDYCRYTGPETFKARKACEASGCTVSGTASCPTAANYKICSMDDKGRTPPSR